MSIANSSEYSDTNDALYVSGSVTITTTATEIKVGASREENRQMVIIYNNSNKTVFFGPAGVTISTGIPLLKEQLVEIPLGDIGIFAIVASSTGTVIVQEIG